MPDSNGQPLPPLPEEAYEHGEKHTADIPQKGELPNKCLHKSNQVTIDHIKREVKCTCGSVWTGFGFEKLYDAMQKQPQKSSST